MEIVYGIATTFPFSATAASSGCDMPAVAACHCARVGMSCTGVTGSAW